MISESDGCAERPGAEGDATHAKREKERERRSDRGLYMSAQ